MERRAAFFAAAALAAFASHANRRTLKHTPLADDTSSGSQSPPERRSAWQGEFHPMQRRVLLLLAGLLSLLAAPRAQAVLLFDGGASEGTGSAIEVTIRVLANDFQLAERSTVESVEVWAQVGAGWDGTLEYFFFEASGNVPAMVPFATGLGTNVTTSAGGAAGELIYRFDLAAPVVLDGGQQYWFGLHMKQSYADDGNYAFWSTTSLDFGDTSRSAEGGNFAAWTIPPDDEAFRLYGELPEPAPALQALAGALALLAARGVRHLAAGR